MALSAEQIRRLLAEINWQTQVENATERKQVRVSGYNPDHELASIEAELSIQLQMRTGG